MYGQFSKCHVCFCGLDSGNLKCETLKLKFCDLKLWKPTVVIYHGPVRRHEAFAGSPARVCRSYVYIYM